MVEHQSYYHFSRTTQCCVSFILHGSPILSSSLQQLYVFSSHLGFFQNMQKYSQIWLRAFVLEFYILFSVHCNKTVYQYIYQINQAVMLSRCIGIQIKIESRKIMHITVNRRAQTSHQLCMSINFL